MMQVTAVREAIAVLWLRNSDFSALYGRKDIESFYRASGATRSLVVCRQAYRSWRMFSGQGI
jgi:hypothetical protein